MQLMPQTKTQNLRIIMKTCKTKCKFINNFITNINSDIILIKNFLDTPNVPIISLACVCVFSTQNILKHKLQFNSNTFPIE